MFRLLQFSSVSQELRFYGVSLVLSAPREDTCKQSTCGRYSELPPQSYPMELRLVLAYDWRKLASYSPNDGLPNSMLSSESDCSKWDSNRMRSAARSAIIMTGAFVFAVSAGRGRVSLSGSIPRQASLNAHLRRYLA